MSSTLDPAVREWLLTPLGPSKWCPLELFEVGIALLDSINTTVVLGHETPGGTLDYVPEWFGKLGPDVVQDFIAWTSGRTATRPGAEARLRADVDESGWSRYCAERMGALMSGEAS